MITQFWWSFEQLIIYVTSFSSMSYYSNSEIDLKNIFETDTSILQYTQIQGLSSLQNAITYLIPKINRIQDSLHNIFMQSHYHYKNYNITILPP